MIVLGTITAQCRSPAASFALVSCGAVVGKPLQFPLHGLLTPAALAILAARARWDG